MNLERSLTYHFDDKEWLKNILIGGLVSVIPIVNFAFFGYALRTLKNITQGRETPLPDWAEFGDYFAKGLLAFIASLIYSIPLIILSCLAGLLDTMMTNQYGYQSAPGGLFAFCFGCLGFLYGLLMYIVLPAALTKYAITEEFADVFRFGEIFRYISANLSNYIIALIVTALLSIVASFVGGLACGIGLLFTTPWSMLAAAHLFAQVYLKSQTQQAPTADVV